MSVSSRIFALVRQSVSTASPEDIEHDLQVEKEASVKMAIAKKKWILDYQSERAQKTQYVQQNVLAQNLQIGKLQRKIQDLKSSIIPSLDDVTMVELQNLVDELQHEENITKEEAEDDEQIDSSKNNGGSGSKENEVSDTTSAVALYEKLQEKEDKELDDSVSSVRSSNSFRSMTTRKAKLTVLNKKAYAQIHVADVYQLITSKLGSMVRGQSLMVVIHTYPMAWKVQRLDIDFVTLRNYLVKKYP